MAYRPPDRELPPEYTSSPSAPAAHDAASAPPAHDAVATAAPEAPTLRTPQAAAADTSMDQLQRRLGQVLGGKGAIEASRSGDLHVVARAGPRRRDG